VFPKTLRQRCLVHKKRNILNKVPQEAAREVKVYLDSIYYAPDYATAKLLAKEFKDKYNQKYPSAIKSFEEDFRACIQHLRCSVGHRRSITTTNLAERSFLEEKRRSKVIPRFFDEKSGLALCFATLIRASQEWNKLHFTFEDQVRIMELREELGHKAIKEEINCRGKDTSYAQQSFSRKNKT